jgi:transcriptional regulator with XRE-family HTH domain
VSILARVGERVRLARKARGLTQLDLAGLAGMSRASIANLEGGVQNTSMTNLEAIADALRLDPASLVLSGAAGRPELAQSADLVAKLYVRAALDQAEQEAVLAVRRAFQHARSVYVGDLEDKRP